MGRTTKCITWLSSPTSMWKWQKIDPFLQRCPCKTTSAGKTWLPLCGLTNCTVLWSLVGGCPWHHLRKSDTNTKSVTLNKKIQPVGFMIWKQSIRLKVKVARSCPTLCDPMDCSPPGSSVHGILQARIPKWAAISLSRGSSWPRDWTQVSYIAGRLFTIWATRETIRLGTVSSFWPFSTSGHVMAHRDDRKSHFSLLVGILEEEFPVTFCEGRRKVSLCEDLLLTPSRRVSWLF